MRSLVVSAETVPAAKLNAIVAAAAVSVFWKVRLVFIDSS